MHSCDNSRQCSEKALVLLDSQTSYVLGGIQLMAVSQKIT